MAGKRTINNSARTVIPSAKSIKIVTRNTNIPNNFEDALGSKGQLQLRNRCINLKNVQVIKHRKSRCYRPKNISLTFSENLKNVTTTNACGANFFVSPETLETSTRTSVIPSLENHQDDDLDYEPDFENCPNSTTRDESPTVTQNLEHHVRNDEFDKVLNTFYDSTTEDNLSVSHRSDMLPYVRAKDNVDVDGQSDYIRYTPTNSSRVLLDSSSSDGSSNKVDNIEDDANSYLSDYDISDDLEKRLLESDETDDELSTSENQISENVFEDDYDEEEAGQTREADFQENCPVFQDSQVRKIGKNFVITAFNTNPKVSIKHPNSTSPKVTIKRPNSTSPKVTIKRPNIRKWNVHYHPYQDVTLLLNDIGYIAPPSRCNLSDSSSDGSGGESATLTNFKVTFGAIYKRRFEKVQPCNENGFKVPLPPIKRPPTRPKRPGSSSTSPCSSLTGSSDTYIKEKCLTMENREVERQRQKEDDAISIVASSIDRFEMEEVQSSLDADIKSNSYVADWVSSHIAIQSNSTPSNSVSSTLPREHSPKISIGARLNFKDVNPFFAGLCFRYYFNENCTRLNCRIPHTVNTAAFTRKCWELQKSELESIYNFTLRFHLLFSEIYPVLLNGFAYHRMQNNLIASLDDIFQLKSVVNSRIAVEKVVAALVATGLTFSEAVEKISFNVGFMRHPELADILLDLITQKPDLSENWEEIKRICRAKNYMPPNILERIISRILLTPTNINKELCRDIYNVVIKNKITDLSQVNAELLNPLKTLAEFNNSSTTTNNKNNNTLSTVIDKNLQIERQRFELDESQNEPRTHIINVDSDDRQLRHVQTTPKKASAPPFSPHSSSRSSTSSDRFTGEQENQHDLIPRDSSYNYVPQAISAFPQTSEEPSSEPNFIINLPPPKFSRPPPTLNRLPSLLTLKIQNPNSPSPKSPLLDINLCPEVPIFGKFKYKKGFVFDECLHNLLPSSSDQVPMNEDDIIKLNDIIRTGNGAGFLQILDQYNCPNTLQSFITMSLAHLKNCDNRPYNSLTDLIENIDIVKPDFKRDPFLKGVFEVIVFNLLFFLERKCQWMDGRKLIESFCDWDSLISSKQLSMRKLTPMGRCIFLAKFLTQAKAFYRVYDILQSTELNILESPDRWSLFHSKTVDLEHRNVLLTEFFKYAYLNNIEVVCDIYRKIFQFGDIWEFDALSYFNPMLENLIDSEKTSSLKHFYTDIEIFHKKMSKNVLRAFIIYLDPHLSIENKFKLYIMGVQKGIYVGYTGKETTILVRNNMPDVELILILQYYMHKLDRLPKDLSNHDLKIEIKLPTEIMKSPNILHKCLRSIAEVNNSVKKILYQCFGILLRQPDQNQNSNSTVVEISKEELKSRSEFRNAFLDDKF